MSQEIGMFRGKKIDADMTKQELLDIIEWLSGEMNRYKQSAEEKGDALNKELLRTLKPTQVNPSTQRFYRA